MKKLYFLFLFFILGFSLFKAQNINIPDANFKQYLVSEYDLNGDGEIQITEAVQVTSISCNSRNITSLVGIKSFVNLTNLYCGGCSIINLDVSGLSKLQSLSCSDNFTMQSLNLDGLLNLKYLSCYSNKLSTLNVQNLTNLKTLLCYQNNLANLDLSGLTKLNTIDCKTNYITSIKVDSNINLNILDCSNNKLTNLDVTGSPNLKTLDCSYNQITSLNVQELIKLTDLLCFHNKLSLLNLQGLKSLYGLNCSYNLLNTLDVSKLTTLGSIICENNLISSINLDGGLNILNNLFCNNNNLTTLDLDDLPNLQTLQLKNNQNLTKLFIKNGFDQTDFLDLSNTNLQYLCCDNSEYDYVQNLINSYGLQNQCSINTYCSFTPGGNFNTIKGTSRIDYDKNGCDVNDLQVSVLKFSLSDGTNSGVLAGNNDGTYKTYTNAGNFTLTPVFENPDYFNVSPSNGRFFFADSNNNMQNQDFCITSNGIKNDLEVKIIPVNNVRPGFQTTFKLIYKNKGNTVLSGDLNFVFDAVKSQFTSSDTDPNSQTSGNLKWNFTDLKPFESRIITVILKTNAPPIVNINDVLKYTSTIHPVSGDLTDYDNTFNLVQNVVGSFDPNDKICLEGEAITSNLIGKYITYKIRFENTGTANAEQVVVKDIIDESMFDVKSLIPITASHSYQTRFTGNNVEFIFENINLPFDDANNDGYIVFKIKTLPTLKVGSKIKNKADIFFDYNLPIKTNEYVSTFQTLATTENVLNSKEISIYPNPAKEVLHIKTEKKLSAVTIYDNVGRIIRKSSSPDKDLDVKMLPKGSYILKIETDKGFSVQKFIKE